MYYIFQEDFYFGLGSSPFSYCPVNNCETTSNVRRLNESDAVIFHIIDLDKLNLPEHRSASQRWIFFSMESPEYTPQKFTDIKNYFNWTMTYRYDEEIYKENMILEWHFWLTEETLTSICLTSLMYLLGMGQTKGISII